MPELHIACAADDGYLPYCATMLQSLLAHHDPADVTVHFMHATGPGAECVQALERFVLARGAAFRAHTMDAAMIAELPSMKRIPRIMWLRIWLPELLPELERVLYLDVDTLILQPLTELWETDLSDSLLGAVDNVLEPESADRPRELGLPESAGYFNSGVLLLHLALMRRERTTERILDYVDTHKHALKWPDQDALNRVLGPRRLRLHPRWNCQNSFLYWRSWALPLFGEEAVDEAVAAPGILHFEGPSWAKPWHYLSDHPYRETWHVCQRDTGWPMPHPPGRTLRNIILRHSPEAAQVPLRALFGRRPRPRPQLGGKWTSE